MSDFAIRVENLGKRYRIGRSQQRHDMLRDALTTSLRSSAKRISSAIRRPASGTDDQTANDDHIWALKDISFEVRQGEVLGIIGRNGAGKSTLLKVLSRITEPTEGRAKIRGRVGSLLEVGTGFHPELTGRENIYLSGAILGMHKEEIDRKFDEIVVFSGVEKFIDTPIKRYSSGMNVRLGFSVAAHLEPEIMLVDEVLAVGDVSFQKKCLGKMGDVAREGRTVMFVSHDMLAVNRLCKRSILMGSGGLLLDGSTSEVTSAYLDSPGRIPPERQWARLANAPGDDVVRLRRVRVRSASGDTVGQIDVSQQIGIELAFDVLVPGRLLTPNCHFYNQSGLNLFVSIDTDPEWRQRPRPVGRYRSTVWIPGHLLSEGSVNVRVAITTFDPWVIHFDERELVGFQVLDSMTPDSARGDFHGHLPGVVRPKLHWTTEFEIPLTSDLLEDETRLETIGRQPSKNPGI